MSTTLYRIAAALAAVGLGFIGFGAHEVRSGQAARTPASFTVELTRAYVERDWPRYVALAFDGRLTADQAASEIRDMTVAYETNGSPPAELGASFEVVRDEATGTGGRLVWVRVVGTDGSVDTYAWTLVAMLGHWVPVDHDRNPGGDHAPAG